MHFLEVATRRGDTCWALFLATGVNSTDTLNPKDRNELERIWARSACTSTKEDLAVIKKNPRADQGQGVSVFCKIGV